MSKKIEFSFKSIAPEFDKHISSSIRGYQDLRSDCVSLSQYFIQKNSKVIDIGCSSGQFLEKVRCYNNKRLSSVKYIGLDYEAGFKEQWNSRKDRNLSFKKADIRTYDGYENLSLVFSLFTLQFLPEKDRLPLVKKIYDGLNEGGAFILSEKLHAKNAKIQEMLTFLYYDFKKSSFSEKEILDKEKDIRDQMKLWSEYKIFEMLRAAGFITANAQIFWRNHLFIGIIAMKPATYR
jgi:tRNA (cmo5U34)-methyltransferase